MPIVKKRNQQTESRLLLESDEPVELPPAEVLDDAVIVQFEKVQPGSDFRFLYPSKPPRKFGAETYRFGTFAFDEAAEVAASTTPRKTVVPPKTTAAPAAAKTAAPAPITYERIAERAYKIWESGQGGSEAENWHRAEMELKNEAGL